MERKNKTLEEITEGRFMATCLNAGEISHRNKCDTYVDIYHCFDSRDCPFKYKQDNKNYCGANMNKPLDKYDLINKVQYKNEPGE